MGSILIVLAWPGPHILRAPSLPRILLELLLDLRSDYDTIFRLEVK